MCKIRKTKYKYSFTDGNCPKCSGLVVYRQMRMDNKEFMATRDEIPDAWKWYCTLCNYTYNIDDYFK